MGRRGARTAGATAVAVLAMTTGLAACSGNDGIVQVRTTTPPSSSSTASSTASSSATSRAPSASPARTATSTTSAPPSGTTSGTASTEPDVVASPPASSPASSLTVDGPMSSPPSPPDPTAARTSSTAATPGRTAAAGPWPKALGEPQQGQAAWGVYLAIGHAADDAAVERAVRQAAGVGYSAVVGDVACDGGAMEALKLDQFNYWTGATLYFGSEADARTFAASYTRAVARPKGLLRVKVGCLD